MKCFCFWLIPSVAPLRSASLPTTINTRYVRTCRLISKMITSVCGRRGHLFDSDFFCSMVWQSTWYMSWPGSINSTYWYSRYRGTTCVVAFCCFYVPIKYYMMSYECIILEVKSIYKGSAWVPASAAPMLRIGKKKSVSLIYIRFILHLL